MLYARYLVQTVEASRLRCCVSRQLVNIGDAIFPLFFFFFAIRRGFLSEYEHVYELGTI